MSSKVSAIDFNPACNRILNQMLHKAGYVTARMQPLTGPLARQSKAVLVRFMSGVMRDGATGTPREPHCVFAFGRA
ncbi:hypothetical protein [Shinella sp. NM-101]|uniref:hypothetical protein n=1 Tax=Shinella sp. NM-101 TaxID=2744455 RepID=UPI001F1E2530|nr:hypothetical protein [Shinella sp. NM-101]